MPSLLPSYGRAALGAVPGSGLLRRLPLVGQGGEEAGELALDGVVADPERLARFCRVCGFTMRGTLPIAFPHVLSFPLQMSLMSSGAFPFPLLGLVHLDNAIVQHRPIPTTESLRFAVRATDPEPHPKGRTVSVVVEASVGGELVWEEAGTILHRGPGDSSTPPPAALPPLPDSAVPTTEWRLPEDLGRRYADASGDRNPIHLHRFSARALGFPRAIAHGMWSMSRCLAQLEGRLDGAARAEARFMKPVLLPSTVSFVVSEGEAGAVGFALRSAGPTGAERPVEHLSGALTPL